MHSAAHDIPSLTTGGANAGTGSALVARFFPARLAPVAYCTSPGARPRFPDPRTDDPAKHSCQARRIRFGLPMPWIGRAAPAIAHDQAHTGFPDRDRRAPGSRRFVARSGYRPTSEHRVGETRNPTPLSRLTGSSVAGRGGMEHLNPEPDLLRLDPSDPAREPDIGLGSGKHGRSLSSE